MLHIMFWHKKMKLLIFIQERDDWVYYFNSEIGKFRKAYVLLGKHAPLWMITIFCLYYEKRTSK